MVSSRTIALVTGANQGVGYEIVKQLASEHPSYHLLLGCRNFDSGLKAVEKLGSLKNITPIQIDVTSEESIKACVDRVATEFGRLDVLINNAGTTGRGFPADISEREKWARINDVNVVGVAFLTEALAPLLHLSERPSVIMASSGLGSVEFLLKSPIWVEDMSYGATKAGLNILMANFVRKYPKWKVNSCSPGFTRSNLNDPTRSDPNAQPTSEGAKPFVKLCIEMGDPSGPNGINRSKNGNLPW